MSRHEQEELSRELTELRRLVDQLGALSVRVHTAADNAIRALNEGVPNGQHR